MKKSPEDTRVLVAMSGGVDSSVAAALLKSQGFDVIGVHMQLSNQAEKNQDRFSGRCCSLIDSNDARRVCDKLDIPYYVINATDVFKENVIDYFVHEYLQSRTPNPCAECNTKIKFNYLFQKADELSCDFVATGHYSQVIQDEVSGLAMMLKAHDHNKDQSYFLYGLSQKALTRTMMPLGGFSKQQVRKLAEQYGLVSVADKPDSQEICFIGTEGYAGFIERRVAESLRPGGQIKTASGEVVGDHDGLHRYTIGQRKGLQLTTKDPGQYFVVGFDRTSNALVVGPEVELLQKELVASHINWIRPLTSMAPIQCKARIRSRHEEADAEVFVLEGSSAIVKFKEAQRAITPGQAIVFYDGDEVIGGGSIDRIGKISS